MTNSSFLIDKNRILEIVSEWNGWSKEIDLGIKRGDYLEKIEKFASSGQVITLTGVRRSGKSYILRQYVKKLISMGFDRHDVIYVNFEDSRLGIDTFEKWDEIYELILKNFGNPSGQKWLLLDEIQHVQGWERWVRTWHELRKAKIIVSGSNSKILSKELGTKLTGRHLDLTVYPLSFKEFVKFNSGEEAKWYLRSYLERGGFPLPVLQPKIADSLMLDYFSDILERDVFDRYAIRSKKKLMELARYLMGNYSAMSSYLKIGKFLDLDGNTVQQYFEYLSEAYLAFEMKLFSFKFKEVEKSPKKIYAIDTGMARLIGLKQGQNLGRLAENAVYLELLRRGFKPTYWKDEVHREVDFVVEDKAGLGAIQGCWDLVDPKTRQREIKSLIKGLEFLKLDRGLVLTEDEEGREVVSGKVIEYKKLSDWLFNS